MTTNHRPGKDPLPENIASDSDKVNQSPLNGQEMQAKIPGIPKSSLLTLQTEYVSILLLFITILLLLSEANKQFMRGLSYQNNQLHQWVIKIITLLMTIDNIVIL